MRKSIILYGIALAVLAGLLKVLEYKMLVRDLTLEAYITLIAILFTALGLWAGRKLINYKKTDPVPAPQLPTLKSGPLTSREQEVLQLISSGHSNQEIADKLFVSLSTVKTHSANIFFKLDVKRRTQAVQRAKELQLIH